VEPAQRLAALTLLILRMNGANGAPRSADRAWPLAAELAALMDEAERAEIDLAGRLPEAADPAYAAHWAQTLEFLHIVTRSWPNWLAEQGMMNPAARLVALLDAQAAAGTTGGIPAVARLLRVVARLPNGAVVLPGLDTAMSEHAWSALDDSHPQAGLARLLQGLGAARGDVRAWPASAADAAIAARGATLSQALLPAAAVAEWRHADRRGIDHLMLCPAISRRISAIAMVLREALETRAPPPHW
jgi:ATP-dependent helicase/nuclease subunit B